MSYDSDIEVITPELQKIQFASSGQVLLSCPDKLHATRTGGYADVVLIFDGNTASVLGKNMNAFVQLEAPGSLNQLVDKLRNDYFVSHPGADLLLSNAFEVLSSDVLHAAHIGQGVVDGFECEHLAFRIEDTDWQLWVQTGDAPIPRKYVITSKTEAGAPQYTLAIRDWKTDVQPGPDAFAFTAPEGAKKLDAAALAALDEVPPGLPWERRNEPDDQEAVARRLGLRHEGAGVLLANDQLPQITAGAFASQAKAIIGRPLTPMSYAGAARRTTRRAYGAPVIYGAPAYAAGCYQAAGPDGGVVTRRP